MCFHRVSSEWSQRERKICLLEKLTHVPCGISFVQANVFRGQHRRTCSCWDTQCWRSDANTIAVYHYACAIRCAIFGNRNVEIVASIESHLNFSPDCAHKYKYFRHAKNECNKWIDDVSLCIFSTQMINYSIAYWRQKGMDALGHTQFDSQCRKRFVAKELIVYSQVDGVIWEIELCFTWRGDISNYVIYGMDDLIPLNAPINMTCICSFSRRMKLV